MTQNPSDTAVYHDPQPRRRRGKWWTWYICGILFLATVLCYLDRQTMSLCAPLIKQDFKLSNQQWGELLSAFRGSYAVVQFFGFLADVVPVRLLYALSVGVWSAAGAAAAFVAGPTALAWTRRVLGAGEAFNWPCALRVTANMVPPEERSLANGIFTSGAATGAALSPLIIAPLASAFGWRIAFFVVGAFGAVWIAVWWFSTRRSDALSAEGQSQAEGGRTERPPSRAPDPSDVRASGLLGSLTGARCRHGQSLHLFHRRMDSPVYARPARIRTGRRGTGFYPDVSRPGPGQCRGWRIG